MVDLVVGHLTDPFRSGVARFNARLAAGLAVPVVALTDPAAREAQLPLISCKLSQLDPEAEQAIREIQPPFRLLLHEVAPGPLETELIERAECVLCANAEVEEHVQALGGDTRLVFAPGMLDDRRELPAPDITVFSFGMAHKLQPEMFGRLRELLEASGRSYALFFSHASHEAATAEDEEAVALEMRALFPGDTLFYLGNLSDVAVYNAIRATTYFASFFPRGMRANNTSIWTAMEGGAVVITNLDGHSPPELVHGQNMLDITRLQQLPLENRDLDKISAAARDTAGQHSWQRLLELTKL